MSARLFPTDVLFLQRILAVSGFYNGPFNGKWTSNVDAAEEQFLAGSEQIKSKASAFDNRTESCIMSLIPAAQGERVHERDQRPASDLTDYF
jgi:peptidoglycan L-alanyl-D-glutamate endopeptidase CwlK